LYLEVDMSELSASSQRTRRLAVGGFALALILGCGGTAVGATMVTSKMIKNDTINPVDLGFATGQDASTLTAQVKLTRTQQQLLTTTISVDDEGGAGIAQGFVELRNAGPNPATISVVLVDQQDSSHSTTVTTTLKAGERSSVPLGLLCDGLPAGDQTVELTAGGLDGVFVESAFLSASVAPHI
jgi:hypothetical protein